MAEIFLRLTFKISLVIFLVGNLAVMGLQLDFRQAIRPLRSFRFIAAILFSGFVIGPFLAYTITLLIPMEEPYAVGLLLLGMAPCAPFLPMVVRIARGSLPATAALMLLTSIGTIVVMPFVVPRVAPALNAQTWAVARPLITLILIPLLGGIALKSVSAAWAGRLHSFLQPVTAVDTLVFLVVIVILHYRSFLNAIGSGAFASQLLLVMCTALGGYLVSKGRPMDERSVFSLGMCTRNIGTAAAIVGESGDQRIMVTLVIATIVTVAVSFATAKLFGRLQPLCHAVPACRAEELPDEIDLRRHPK